METAAQNYNSKIPRAQNEYITNSCRICMARDIEMNYLFSKDSNDNLVDKIEFCTGIQLSKEDGLPAKICSNCLQDLSIAHKFKTSCLHADQTFRKILIEATIKIETPEMNDDDFGNENVLYDDNTEYSGDGNGIKVEMEENDFVKDISAKSSVLDNKVKQSQKEKKEKRAYTKTKSKMKMINTKTFRYKKLWCVVCNIQFDNKTLYEKHRKEVHNAEDNWICEICGKMYVHRASHHQHLKSHFPPQYSCEKCDYKTWNKYDLAKHIHIHTGTKNYQCEFCTASFHTSSNLVSHIQRKHQGLKRFTCTMCEKTFFDRTKLNRHIDSHNDVKRYKCDFCSSCFTRRCYWKKHLARQHSIEIPPQRPGRQKINLLIGENLLKAVDLLKETAKI